MAQQRPLTNDEKKAAEAAFQGRPFDPTWSKAAQVVYDSLLEAIQVSPSFLTKSGVPSSAVEDCSMQQISGGLEPKVFTRLGATETEFIDESPSSASKQITLRKESIDSGILIDVSKTAREIGLNFSVGITKSLWGKSIAASLDISQNEREARIRDMLLAVRLRLAALKTPSPWVQVPVLLAFKDNQMPQLFSIYALFHKDSDAGECLTLIHPHEISSATPIPYFNEDSFV